MERARHARQRSLIDAAALAACDSSDAAH